MRRTNLTMSWIDYVLDIKRLVSSSSVEEQSEEEVNTSFLRRSQRERHSPKGLEDYERDIGDGDC